MKVVLKFDLGEAFVNDLKASFPDVDFRSVDTQEEEIREIVDAEIQFGEISREAFEVAKKLRWFHFIGMGFDGYKNNFSEMFDGEFIFTRAPGTHVIPMAEHTFAMILAYAHRIPDFVVEKQAHRWNTEDFMDKIIELAGTTMGIISMGGIGKGIAQRAQGFDMDVYAVDSQPMSPPPGVSEVWGMDRLDDLLARSDWVVVTTPYTKESHHLIDRQRIERMKPGAFIAIMSRGGIVDEEALIDALRSGHVAGAGIDAFGQEPLPTDSLFWDLPNVIITPHISAHSPQLWLRRGQIFKDNLKRYLAGEPLLHVCDMNTEF